MLHKISMYHILEINNDISTTTRHCICKFALSHKMQIPDALIAATATTYNLPLFTYNIKDFKFIPNIKLYSFS